MDDVSDLVKRLVAEGNKRDDDLLEDAADRIEQLEQENDVLKGKLHEANMAARAFLRELKREE